ncbi:hypothetical protein TWF132_007555 [Orbilia oligospora]|nr:hypothetical protein TWF132_007555 [Orbilia oligospora]
MQAIQPFHNPSSFSRGIIQQHRDKIQSINLERPFPIYCNYLSTSRPKTNSKMTVNTSESSARGTDLSQGASATNAAVTVPKSRWFIPKEMQNDMLNTGLSEEIRIEVLNTGWEYTRAVIPIWSNWARYLAFARILTAEFTCEFCGDLFRPEETDEMVGYNLQEQVDILFGGTPLHKEMEREIRSFFVSVSEKVSSAKDGSDLFRRHTNALGHSAKDYYRLRDCDGTIRFTMAAALACNDIDMSKHWFNEEQVQLLAEICLGLYDSVAYFKHRAEGEISNFFAYVGGDMRLEMTHLYRELLWALEAAWATKPESTHVTNFMRQVGGTIHMTMRRYRFIEDGLTIGRPETAQVVEGTRNNVNLWYRVEPNTKVIKADRYPGWVALKERFMFEGLAECLDRSEADECPDCVRRDDYGAQDIYQFGGVVLCAKCKQEWIDYVRCLPARAAKLFPELKKLPEYWD